MPRLNRSDWYDLARDMNWNLRYVSEEEAFPPTLAGSYGHIPPEAWWTWDEPYKLTYREYTHNQAEKDASVHAVASAVARSRLFEELDSGWKGSIKAHYGGVAVTEAQSTLAESRMGRFGRAAAWRNMALFGALDEMRHVQLQLVIPHALLEKDAQFDWAHKALHTENWASIATRSLNDDLFLANDVVSTAIQLTFTFETGFTNLQFLGMAADAMEIGDLEFGALISSIQTDEARHAQQGEPTLKILLEHGEKETAQRLIDHAFWRSWHLFATVTGPSMDYWTPLEYRTMSFKEFMQEWIVKQFIDQIEDIGLERPWYWDIFMDELEWYHHAEHAGIWFWRPTVWWHPDGGVSRAERAWLDEKYPEWEARFGPFWDSISSNVRGDNMEKTFGETLPILCNLCHLPVVNPSRGTAGGFVIGPRQLDYEGRKYQFCSDPCKWIFELDPSRYAGHTTIVDRFLSGEISPATPEAVVEYMGITPDVSGDDASDYSWAREPVPSS